MIKKSIIEDYIKSARENNQNMMFFTSSGTFTGTPNIVYDANNEVADFIVLSDATFVQGSCNHTINAVNIFIDSIDAVAVI